MPGVRPGKVPVKLIQQMYGQSIKLDVQEQIAQEHFRNYIEKNKITAIGNPALTDIKENEDGSQAYIIRFDVIPDFELKDYKSLEVFEPFHKVSDAEVEKEISLRAANLGKFVDAEIIKDCDVAVIVDEYIIGKESNETDTNPPQEVTYNLFDKDEDPAIKELFLNHKIGDEIEYDTDEIKFKYVIKSIKQSVPCEINDEFAKLSSKGRFENMDDYRQEIGFAIQQL
jgi:trigger factor